jgi:hypothetical protein
MDLFTRPWGDCIIDDGGNQIATLSCIWPLMSNLINAALVLSAVVALYYIIISGLRFISSRGDAQALENAKKTLTFAIIGFAFILLSFTFFNLIFTITGIENDVVAPNPNEGNRLEVTPPSDF